MVVSTTWAVHMGRWRRGDRDDGGCAHSAGGVGHAVAVFMAVAPCGIGPTFRLEGLGGFGHDQVLLTQHVGQHMVGLQLQVIGAQFQRDMALAQVVGGAQQVERCAVFGAGAHHQHRLRRGQHAHQRAIVDHQHVATAHQGAARQEHAQRAALRIGGLEAAFLTHVPVEFDGGSAFEQHRGQATALGDEFVDGQHRRIVARSGRSQDPRSKIQDPRLRRSEQKVLLRHLQVGRRLAGQQQPVGAPTQLSIFFRGGWR